MIVRRAAMLALALGAAGSLVAQAETPFGVSNVTGPDGIYGRAEGGWSHQNQDNLDSAITGTIKPDEGYVAGAALGYKTGQLRLELGFDFSHQDVKSASIGDDGGLGHRLGLRSLNGLSGGAGNIENDAVMFNASWDLRTGSRWVPYLGVGVGGAEVSLNDLMVGGVPVSNSSDFVFAYQPFVGVRYMLTDRLALGLEYRYVATVDPTFKDSSGRPFNGKYESHNVLAGLTYHFGAESPPPVAAPTPPPPPTPVAAAEPAPAPAHEREFLVFFDFDRATLTSAGKRVVEQAATAAQDSGTRVQLTGYTDLAGTQKYNIELSHRRAEVVRDELVRLGVASDIIGLAWRGKENPRVPTADGVREPQNRRVEINIP